MENGIAAGSLFIPGSIKGGDYNLIAYTNTFSQERHPILFQQQISIKKEDDEYSISFEDAGINRGGGSAALICKIRNRQNHYPGNLPIKYRILLNDSMIATGKKTVNNFGEVSIPFPYTELRGKWSFDAVVFAGKDSFPLTRKVLTAFDNRIRFRWFPEGGQLISNIKTKIAFEATTFSGMPAVISGMLYKDDMPLASLQTNSAGLGTVELKADSGNYSVRLAENTHQAITALNFPEIKKTGYSLSVKNSIAEDTIAVNIEGCNAGNTVHLMIHDYHSLLGYYDITLPPGGMLFKIPLADMTPGVLVLTLLDSAEQPCAERTILAGINRIPAVTMQADSLSYHKRSKVKLKLLIRDPKGNPLAGSVSLACVYQKRIDTITYSNIVPYAIFNNYFQHGLMDRIPMYRLGTNEDLDMTLLARFRPGFNEPLTNPAVARYAAGTNPDVTGYVIHDNSNVHVPVMISVIGEKGFGQLYTDSSGLFIIPAEMLASNPNGKFIIKAGENNDAGYQIIFHHLTDTLQKKLASLSFAEPAQIKAFFLLTDDRPAQPAEKMLETVVLKPKKKSGEGAYTSSVFKSKTCYDWVCMNNVLNCPIHPYGGTKPVDGDVYQYYFHFPDNLGSTTYKGCALGVNPYSEEIFNWIKGRYYSKEFNKADYGLFNPPVPEIQSTILWQPKIITDDSGEADINFYTNDLTGNFLVIVQGMTYNGPVFGSAVITTIE